MPIPLRPGGNKVPWLLIALGILVYPVYAILGELAAGLVYTAGFILSIALLLRGSSQGPQWSPPSSSVVLGVFPAFLLLRLAESLAWGSREVYVLEKLLGLGVIALLSGGELPYVRKPRLKGASLFSVSLFTLVAIAMPMECFSPPAPGLLPLIVPLIIVNSLFEEGLFRGLMLRSLTLKLGATAGVVGQALLFSLWHTPHVIWSLGWPGVFYLAATFLVGVSLGVVALFEGGVLTPVLVHTLWNLGVMFSCPGLAPPVLLVWAVLALAFFVGGKVFRNRG